jgi:hypothetical protein
MDLTEFLSHYDINTHLLFATLWSAVAALFIEAMMEHFKTLQKKWAGQSYSGKLNNLERERALYVTRASRCTTDPELYEHYMGMANEVMLNIKVEMRHNHPSSWINIIVPVIFGVSFVAIFYPTTLFTFLPFGPSNYYVSAAVSAVILSRTANGLHGSSSKVSGIFDSLIGRIFPR